MNQRQASSDLSFLEHCIELRGVVLYSVLTIVICSSIVHVYIDQVISFLLKPLGMDAEALQFLSPLEPLFFILKIDFTLGFLIALPLVAFIIWRFVAPATKTPTWSVLLVIGIASVLTLGGSTYAYHVVVPIVLTFMSSLVMDGTVIAYTAQGYIHFLLSTTILLVLIFQIPLVIIALTILNLLDPREITKRRPYVYSGTFILAAIITPTTDVVTLGLVALPAIAVTEIGALLANLLRPKSDSALNH